VRIKQFFNKIKLTSRSGTNSDTLISIASCNVLSLIASFSIKGTIRSFLKSDKLTLISSFAHDNRTYSHEVKMSSKKDLQNNCFISIYEVIELT
jgi:hypothetical protein